MWEFTLTLRDTYSLFILHCVWLHLNIQSGETGPEKHHFRGSVEACFSFPSVDIKKTLWFTLSGLLFKVAFPSFLLFIWSVPYITSYCIWGSGHLTVDVTMVMVACSHPPAPVAVPSLGFISSFLFCSPFVLNMWHTEKPSYLPLCDSPYLLVLKQKMWDRLLGEYYASAFLDLRARCAPTPTSVTLLLVLFHTST